MMKEKNLQPRILCPVRLLIRFDREIKFYGQVKANRIQHHQTSFATNAKETALGEKETSNLKQSGTYTGMFCKSSPFNNGISKSLKGPCCLRERHSGTPDREGLLQKDL